MSPLEIRESVDTKVRKKLFKPVARFLTGADAEDRLQDGIAQTFEMFKNYAERGRVLDDGILVHSCRQRATDLGRRFVKKDAQPRRDALHPANYRDGKTEVLRLDGLVDDDGDFIGEQAEGEAFGYAEALAPNPTRALNSAIEVWLSKPFETEDLLAAITLARARASDQVSAPREPT